MTLSMLVDATHAEETRIAVVDEGRIIDFDYESSIRQQLKGSIFLAKVTRVEPSLQASFVNFGGNRHGFLPFNEVHPDYFRIPIADREAILEEQKAYMEALAAEEEEADLEEEENVVLTSSEDVPEEEENSDTDAEEEEVDSEKKKGKSRGRNYKGRSRGRRASLDSRKVEVVGGDIVEGEHTPRPTLRKNYKIQEVVKRSQIMLVQAQKEERGNKGAAVTTYISLPGRYCVLMPNSPRGGGVSRKIANYKERKRMREILKELNVPDGMSVILRTAGVARTKVEIKRDLDYLMRLWDDIRALTLESIAPACVYEEGSLIKRGVRDIYTRDIEEIVIAGEDAFKDAKKFMKMLIPSHAKKVVHYKDETIPLFHKYKVESQIVEMGGPEARLRSGGSIVINPTEALVAIDVNSGRATKERHIEETALRTNLEAAEEVSRQLKLRDLGGLIVIDFIDMENYRNNAKVERRLKECLSSDRARIQIGRISSFGLLELSRQRLNPSMTEAQFKLCDSCRGLGHTRTTDSTAIIALRTIEEFAINTPTKKNAPKETTGQEQEQEKEPITLTVTNKVALFILNNKRDLLSYIEKTHQCVVVLRVDDSLAPSDFLINDEPPAPPESENKKKFSSNTRGHKQKSHHRNQKSAQKPNENNAQDSDGDDAPEKKPKRRRSRKPKNTGKTENKDMSVEQKPDNSKSDQAQSDQAKDVSNNNTKKTPEKAKPEKAKPEKAKEDQKDQPKKEPKAKSPKKSDSKSNSKVEVKLVTKPEELPEAKDYEVVNEVPKKKKKGWWSKG